MPVTSGDGRPQARASATAAPWRCTWKTPTASTSSASPKRTSATPIAGRSSNGLRALTRAAPGAAAGPAFGRGGEAQAVERLAEGRLGLGERLLGRRAADGVAEAVAHEERLQLHERRGVGDAGSAPCARACARRRASPSRSRAARRRRPGRASGSRGRPRSRRGPCRAHSASRVITRFGTDPSAAAGAAMRHGGAVGPARRQRQLVGIRAHGGHGRRSAQTSSMYAISAASPRRGPSLMMRV